MNNWRGHFSAARQLVPLVNQVVAMGRSKIDIPETEKQDFWELFVHPHVPLGYKIGLVLFLLLYLVSPIDIIPDFLIPLFGYADDVGVVMLSANLFTSNANRRLAHLRELTPTNLLIYQRSNLASIGAFIMTVGIVFITPAPKWSAIPIAIGASFLARLAVRLIFDRAILRDEVLAQAQSLPSEASHAPASESLQQGLRQGRSLKDDQFEQLLQREKPKWDAADHRHNPLDRE
jgi:uncharacterized membrane protein YkvA (DUF1232 family)